MPTRFALLLLFCATAGFAQIAITGTLPQGEVGVGYTATISVPGSAPFTGISVTPSDLPAGLSATTGGVVSGTPTQAGNFMLHVTVTDNSSVVGAGIVSLTIISGPSITTTSLPSGTNQAYNATLAATGGTPPYSWSIALGGLPPGLILNSSGVISGTPSTVATATPTFRVTDSAGGSNTKALTVAIYPPLYLASQSPPGGQVGQPYSAPLSANGGSGVYTWSITAGALPPGLSLTPQPGAINGTPTTPGTANLTLTVTDTANNTVSIPTSITIIPAALVITSITPPTTLVGQAYTTTLTATGGIPPYTWSVVSGLLPPGLTLAPRTGVISGTPTTGGTYNLAVAVTDSARPAVTTMGPFAIVVASPLTVTTTSLPNGEVGSAYTAPVAVSGGVAPYTWSITQGTLPGGLTLNAQTGAITGTPVAVGTSQFLVRVTDSSTMQLNGGAVLSIRIIPGMVITPTVISGGTSTKPYSAPFAATGGQPPYTWSISQGNVPGLSIDPVSGLLSGTLGPPGTYVFTVQVGDTINAKATAQLTLVVAPPPLSITTTSLPNGVVGQSYSAVLGVNSGVPPYQWSVQGSLPAGLSIDPASGAITGTPPAAGVSSFIVAVKDSSVGLATANLSITVVTPPLTITTSSLPNASLGQSYSTSMQASGGAPPYSWTATGLPAGLSISTGGAITGTPSSAGTANIAVTVTDKNGQTASKSYTLGVINGLSTGTTSLLDGEVLVIYSASISGTGSSLPQTFRVTGGNLPAGLSLSTSGSITGTPTQAGTANFTVTISIDAPSGTTSQAFSITIYPPLQVTGTLPVGATGAAYSGQVNVTGGKPPYSFSWIGSLPAGLVFNSDGSITGTPNAAGSGAVTVKVTDLLAGAASASYTVQIAAAPSITTTSLPNGTAGAGYSATITGQGTAPLTFSLSSGALPDGLSLSSGGAISGTPTKAGSFSFTVQLTDANKLSVSGQLSITVVNPSLPPVNVTQIGNTGNSGSQLMFGVSLGQTYPVDLAGTATLSFQPVAGPGDPSIVFPNNQQTLNFTIPAGQTVGVPPSGTPLMFSTGTTAGAVTITINFTANGQPLNPSPAATQTITIAKAAPVITSVKMVQTSSGINVVVIGYSNTREVSGATYNFTAAAGSTLSNSQFSVSGVSQAIATWYGTSDSTAFGTQFQLTMPFSLAGGSPTSLSSVQVTLTNSVGSTTATGGF